MAPAKINLFLAVTGRRPDGYHDLVSVAAPLTWGDSISVEPGGAAFSLDCDNLAIPAGADNLVIHAAQAFAAATGWKGGARFTLVKRIPAGAGLGGASSDAASALKALNAIAGNPLDAAALTLVASQVGSDCALFLANAPVVMRGRGERVELLGRDAYSRIRGARVLVFKPGFSVATAWAYRRLAAEGARAYVAAPKAEARLSSWVSDAKAPVGDLMFNSMESAVFAKFPALHLLTELIRYRFGIPVRMSGSGSACFAVLKESADTRPIEATIRAAWGPSAFIVDTRIA